MTNKMGIDKLRNEYFSAGLTQQNADKNPIVQFEKWLKEAIESDEKEPTAVILSTIGEDNFPQSRVVLLKHFDENGFTFFTNYLSDKGKAIENNPSVGLHFFWPSLARQVRITGLAEKTTAEISENYFKSRPLESRIGAWASEQSSEIPSREYLEQRYIEFSHLYKKEPPLPPFWGGYNVNPRKIEFWQGRENRLHDRLLYEKIQEGWKIKRLAP